MKTTAIFSILAVGATSVSAAALAEAEPICMWVGQSCYKVKREPVAEADPICMWVGQSCYKVKRTAEAFANAIATSGDASLTRRSVVGDDAHKAIRALDGLANIVASTQANPRSFYTDLLLESYFPAPVEEAAAEKREAEAEPICMWVGQSCYKVKRAAEAVINTIDSFASVEKREAEANPICMWVGQSCYKRSEENAVRRCNAPGGACSAASRDLNAMYHAARQVLDSLPAQ